MQTQQPRARLSAFDRDTGRGASTPLNSPADACDSGARLRPQQAGLPCQPGGDCLPTRPRVYGTTTCPPESSPEHSAGTTPRTGPQQDAGLGPTPLVCTPHPAPLPHSPLPPTPPGIPLQTWFREGLVGHVGVGPTRAHSADSSALGAGPEQPQHVEKQAACGQGGRAPGLERPPDHMCTHTGALPRARAAGP